MKKKTDKPQVHDHDWRETEKIPIRWLNKVTCEVCNKEKCYITRNPNVNESDYDTLSTPKRRN